MHYIKDYSCSWRIYRIIWKVYLGIRNTSEWSLDSIHILFYPFLSKFYFLISPDIWPSILLFCHLDLPAWLQVQITSAKCSSKFISIFYCMFVPFFRYLVERLYCKRAVKSPSQYYCCFLHWWWSKIDTFLSWKTFFDLDGGNCTLFE